MDLAGLEAPETIEQKYVFANGEAERIAAWMEYAAAPDPQHAEGVLHTVYFDTFDLRHYLEKRESDFLKMKARLRWYESADGPTAPPLAAYLEAKRKVGSVRRKERWPVPSEYCVAPFNASALRSAVAEACSLDYGGSRPMVPVLHLSYARRRYVEGATGARLSLDTRIRTCWANDAVLAGGAPTSLAVGVLEIKSPHRHLLRTLEPLAPFLRKMAFSKYAQCLEHYAYPLSLRL